MTTDERLERLTGIVDAPASSVVAHDNPIEALIKIGEQQKRDLDQLREAVSATRDAVAATVRQWQAYLRTLSRQ